jgi:hypothetical protein
VDVDLWFDPTCPWCWNTSRWLNEVARTRDLTISWRSFSLAMKNADRTEQSERRRVRGEKTLRMLRVVEAARAAGADDVIGALYTEFGRRVHHEHEIDFDLGRALKDAGLDPELAAAADDADFDAAIAASMSQATDLAGDDVGVPILGFDVDGARRGFFGPILVHVPYGDEATRLWDGLMACAAVGGFSELKRRRDSGPQLPPHA